MFEMKNSMLYLAQRTKSGVIEMGNEERIMNMNDMEEDEQKTEGKRKTRRIDKGQMKQREVKEIG